MKKIFIPVIISLTAIVASCKPEPINNKNTDKELLIKINSQKISKAIIDEEYLPEGSEVGIFLKEKDLSTYNVANVSYTATGKSEQQSWSKTNIDDYASVGEKDTEVFSYYPYLPYSNLDIHNIPINIYEQKDWMWGTPYHYVNSSFPQAEITMNHALTKINLQIYIPDYTSTTQIEAFISSPALGTNATLDATNGRLYDISGKGENLNIELTEGGLGTHQGILLAIPDNLASGETTITVKIDNKTYTAQTDIQYNSNVSNNILLEILSSNDLIVNTINVTQWKEKMTYGQFSQKEKIIINGDTENILIKKRFEDNNCLIEAIAVNEDEIVNKISVSGNPIVMGSTIQVYNNSILKINIMNCLSHDETTYITFNGVQKLNKIKAIFQSADPNKDERIIYDTSNIQKMYVDGVEIDKCSTYMFGDTEPHEVTYYFYNTMTSAEDLFYNCLQMVSIDVSGFDTGKVTNMESMFSGCRSLTSLDLSGFDTSNVTDMEWMFSGCSGLTSLDVSGFDTGKVTSMGYMFSGCSGLASLDVSGFDTSNVTMMQSMFSNCSGLTSLDLSGFDTSKVTNMGSMFDSCSGLTSLDVSDFDTSKVTNMQNMFYYCSGLKTVNLGSWNIGTQTYYSFCFSGCRNLSTIRIENDFKIMATNFFDSIKNQNITFEYPVGYDIASITEYIPSNWTLSEY